MKQYLVCAALVLACTLVSSESVVTERRLGGALMANYQQVGTAGRPVANASDPINLALELTLVRIVDVDDKEQTFSAVVFLKMFWEDALMRWDPAEFEGIENIHVSDANIWTPDIELFNAAEPPLSLTVRPPRVYVLNTGAVIWVPMYKLTSACKMKTDDDQPTCTFKLGSWVYNSEQIKLSIKQEYVDLSAYEQHRDWEVLSTKGVKTDKKYDCCPDKLYSDATYSITLKRRVKRVREERPTQSGAPYRLPNFPLLVVVVCWVLSRI